MQQKRNSSEETQEPTVDRLAPCGADVLIRPDVSFMGRLVPHDATKCIAIGRASAIRALPEIRRLLKR